MDDGKASQLCQSQAGDAVCLSYTRDAWAVKDYVDESQAAESKHTVITTEKAIGTTKRYLQLTIVMAPKHSANVHATPRMRTNVSVGRPASCQARIAANR